MCAHDMWSLRHSVVSLSKYSENKTLQNNKTARGENNKVVIWLPQRIKNRTVSVSEKASIDCKTKHMLHFGGTITLFLY